MHHTAFAPVKRLKVSHQIAASLRDAILDGRYSPGDPLPSERDMAATFGVNRSSVREAVLRLESQGLVEIRHGGGTRVRDFLASAGLHLLPFLIAPSGRLDLELLADLLEIRVVLLGWTAGKAAERATPEGIARLEELIGLLAEARVPEELQRLDYDFFAVLVEMSGNRVLRMISTAVRRVYEQNLELFLSLYPRGGIDLAHHRATLDAVRAADSAAASAAMEAYGSFIPDLLPADAPDDPDDPDDPSDDAPLDEVDHV